MAGASNMTDDSIAGPAAGVAGKTRYSTITLAIPKVITSASISPVKFSCPKLPKTMIATPINANQIPTIAARLNLSPTKANARIAAIIGVAA